MKKTVQFFAIFAVFSLMSVVAFAQQSWTQNVTVKPKPEFNGFAETTACAGDSVILTFKAFFPTNADSVLSITSSTGAWATANAVGLPTTFSVANAIRIGSQYLKFVSRDATTLLATYTVKVPVKNNTLSDIVLSGNITVEAGGCTKTEAYSGLTVHPRPTHTPIANTAICNGTAWGSTITTSYANATFNITTTAQTGTFSTPNLFPVGNNIAAATGIASTTYTNSGVADASVTYKIVAVEHGCKGDSSNVTLTVRAPLTIVAAPATQGLCSGTQMTTVTYNKTSPTDYTPNYAWSTSNTGATVTGQTNNGTGNIERATLVNGGNTVNGTVTYSVTATANTCTATFTHVVTVKPIPAITLTATQEICSGQNITTQTATHSVTESSPTVVWSWSAATGTPVITGFTTTGTSATIPADVLTNPSTTNDGQVTYTMSVTVNGCVASTTKTHVVTVHPAPTITFTPTGSDTICPGTPTTFTMTCSAPGTYSWTATNATNATATTLLGSGTFGTNQIVVTLNNKDALQAGTEGIVFHVTPTASSGSCANTPQDYTVFVRPKPTVQFSSNPVCEDDLEITFKGSKQPFTLTYGYKKAPGTTVLNPSMIGLSNSFNGMAQSGSNPDFTYTKTLTGISTGQYTFLFKEIEDGNGCKNTNPAPDAGIIW